MRTVNWMYERRALIKEQRFQWLSLHCYGEQKRLERAFDSPGGELVAKRGGFTSVNVNRKMTVVYSPGVTLVKFFSTSFKFQSIVLHPHNENYFLKN